ncbi:MAG: hypothetical protein ABI847_16605, partial [Anaerolineales bacterium]
MDERGTLTQRLGALAGGLIGLALALGLWGADIAALAGQPFALQVPLWLAGGALVVGLGALAGWLAARLHSGLLAAGLWLLAAVLSLLAAGHLPFEGRTLLAWLADGRFWGLPIYPFDAAAQTRLVLAGFFPVPLLAILGALQGYRLEGIRGALDRRRLTPRAWLLLALPLPFVFAAGQAADGLINGPLRAPAAAAAQVIRAGRDYPGEPDALARQPGGDYTALRGLHTDLDGDYQLMLGDIDLDTEQTVNVTALFRSGAWINCRVLVERVSFCYDASPAYTSGFSALLTGQGSDPACANCQPQLSDAWRAWLLDQGRRFQAAPQVARLGQQGSYVWMRATDPA